MRNWRQQRHVLNSGHSRLSSPSFLFVFWLRRQLKGGNAELSSQEMVPAKTGVAAIEELVTDRKHCHPYHGTLGCCPLSR